VNEDASVSTRGAFLYNAANIGSASGSKVV